MPVDHCCCAALQLQPDQKLLPKPSMCSLYGWSAVLGCTAELQDSLTLAAARLFEGGIVCVDDDRPCKARLPPPVRPPPHRGRAVGWLRKPPPPLPKPPPPSPPRCPPPAGRVGVLGVMRAIAEEVYLPVPGSAAFLADRALAEAYRKLLGPPARRRGTIEYAAEVPELFGGA